ncbi:MAG: sigma-70 family RNA polymerase sigma factor [Acidobacteria bacterium]|nr:sigma-70 family RNA polymerase sigma factor [Acidobacteriota bacterium]
MDETETITPQVEDEADQGAIEDESALFAQLVPKDEDRRVEEIDESQDSADRMNLIRYDPLRHYLLEISRYEPLSQDEERRLARLLRDRQDRDAARKLVTSHLKLVVKVAFLYNKVYANLMDLIQEGNVGLLQAVRKFDPDRGTRLSTYATWWIKAYIIKFILDNFRIVRVGTTNDRRKVLMNLRKEKRKLEAQGIAASPQLIAQALDVSEEDVIAVETSIQSYDLSLDQKVADDSEASYLDRLTSTEELIDERLAAGELKEFIDAKLSEFSNGLSEKGQMILQKRLLAEDPLTLQAIADKYGVTREAIRISEKRLVEKIKSYMKEALRDIRDVRFSLGG